MEVSWTVEVIRFLINLARAPLRALAHERKILGTTQRQLVTLLIRMKKWRGLKNTIWIALE